MAQDQPPTVPHSETPGAVQLATRLQDLQQQHTACRQTLAQLDAQRAQVQNALLRLEGAIGVVQELLSSVD